jgi:hypothetical protein
MKPTVAKEVQNLVGRLTTPRQHPVVSRQDDVIGLTLE